MPFVIRSLLVCRLYALYGIAARNQWHIGVFNDDFNLVHELCISHIHHPSALKLKHLKEESVCYPHPPYVTRLFFLAPEHVYEIHRFLRFFFADAATPRMDDSLCL